METSSAPARTEPGTKPADDAVPPFLPYLNTQDDRFFDNFAFYLGRNACPKTGLDVHEVLEAAATIGGMRDLAQEQPAALFRTLLPVRRAVDGISARPLFGASRDEAKRMAAHDLVAARYLKVVRGILVALFGTEVDAVRRGLRIRRLNGDDYAEVDARWLDENLEHFLRSLSDMGYECLRRQAMSVLAERFFDPAHPFDADWQAHGRVLALVGGWFYRPIEAAPVPTDAAPVSVVPRQAVRPAALRVPPEADSPKRPCLLRNDAACQCARLLGAWDATTSRPCDDPAHAKAPAVKAVPSALAARGPVPSNPAPPHRAPMPPAKPSAAASEPVRSDLQAASATEWTPRIDPRADYDRLDNFRCYCDPLPGEVHPPKVWPWTPPGARARVFRCLNCKIYAKDYEILQKTFRRRPLCDCGLYSVEITVDRRGSANFGKKAYACRYYPESRCAFARVVPENPARRPAPSSSSSSKGFAPKRAATAGGAPAKRPKVAAPRQ